MARKRKADEPASVAQQPELAPVAPLPTAPTPAPTRPTIPEYAPASEISNLKSEISKSKWRVERWELLRAEFPDVTEESLPRFHAWLAQFPRQWMIVRRLFGVIPFAQSLDQDPDDFRPWSRLELSAAVGVGEQELAAELEVVRSGWSQSETASLNETAKRRNGETAKRRNGESLKAPAQPELLETEDEVLKRHGYPPSMFGDCDKEENRLERAWFVARIKQFEPLLTRSPMARDLARQALHSELDLHRLESEVWELDRQRRELPPGSMDAAERLEKKRSAVRKQMAEIESAYRAQLAAIQDFAPWFNVTGQEITQEQCLADFVQRFQAYDADPAHQRLDGVFTATEMQKLLQTSVQTPEPRYRAGWVTYINESKGWLHNPAAKSRFRPRDLAKLDAAWKETVRRFNEETDEHVPDLEKEGKDGEYEDLYTPDEDGPVIRAEVHVARVGAAAPAAEPGAEFEEEES